MSPRRQITYSQHPNHAARSAHAKGEKAFRTYDTSYIRPKRSPIPAILGVIVLVVAVIAIIMLVVQFMRGCTSNNMLPEGETVQITVIEGEGPKSIAKTLFDAGLIESQRAFTDRVNELGADTTLHPGTYTIAGGTSIDEIIAMMQTPVAAGMTFTIPEGSTLDQIAVIVETATGGRITAEEFKAAASDASVYADDYDFLEEAGDNSLEGFLFPKTYPFKDDSTAEDLVRAMLDQFQSETASLDLSVAAEHGLSFYDVVKLASIIERETDENYRPTVASVLYNRLDADMMLQSDATLAYIVGGEPTPEDLESDDPYNTYTNYGLPPTPIGSPSLDCLEAACSPEDTDYLYFYIAPNEDGVVEHYFSETYEEHQSSYE